MQHTLGISPKVLRPFILALVAGATLYAIGLHAEAKGVLAAAAMGLVAGHTAPAGVVMTDTTNDLDELADA